MASELVEKHFPGLWDCGCDGDEENFIKFLAAFEREAKLAGALEMAAFVDESPSLGDVGVFGNSLKRVIAEMIRQEARRRAALPKMEE